MGFAANIENSRKSVDVIDVAKHALMITFLIAKKTGVNIILEKRPASEVRAGKIYLSFAGSQKQLEKLATQFDTLHLRIDEGFPTSFPMNDTKDGILEVDIAPMLNQPDALAELAQVENRRHANWRMMGKIGKWGALAFPLHVMFKAGAMPPEQLRGEIAVGTLVGSAGHKTYQSGDFINDKQQLGARIDGADPKQLEQTYALFRHYFIGELTSFYESKGVSILSTGAEIG